MISKLMLSETQVAALWDHEVPLTELVAAHVKHHDTHFQNQRATEKARSARTRLVGTIAGLMLGAGDPIEESQLQGLTELMIHEYRAEHGRALVPVPVYFVESVRGLGEDEVVTRFGRAYQVHDADQAVRLQASYDYGHRPLAFRETERGTEVAIIDPVSHTELWTANYYRAVPAGENRGL